MELNIEIIASKRGEMAVLGEMTIHLMGGEVRTSNIVGHESHEVVGRPEASVWSEWQELPEQRGAYQRLQTITIKIEDGDWIVVKSTYMDRVLYTELHNIDNEIRQIPLAEYWFGGGMENETFFVLGKTVTKEEYKIFSETYKQHGA